MNERDIVNGILLIFSAGVILQWIRAIGRGRQARRNPRWTRPAAPAAWPAVSVVVPAWRERGTIEVCLRDLAAVDYPTFDVIVVAGGSDGTLDVARQAAAGDARIRAVAQRPAGKSGAMNDGVRLTGGEIIVFLDADSRVSPGWLKEMVAPLREPIVATTGNHVPLLDTRVTRHERMQNVLEYEVRGRVMLQGSGSFAVRRDVFDIIGDFPEGVYADDWDLTWRLAQHGLDRAFAPGAIVRSERPANLKEWFENELRWRRIHLRSLFRLPEEVFRTPLAAARHLLPYLLAWASLGLTGGAAAALLTPALAGVRPVAVELWILFLAWCVSGEWAMIGEATAFTRTREWLRVAPLAPLLVSMEFASCCLATLTSGSAPVQYKGPRRGSVLAGVSDGGEQTYAEVRTP